MDQEDRGKIRDNLDELVRVTKWSPVLENCVDGIESLRKVLEKIRVSFMIALSGTWEIG